MAIAIHERTQVPFLDLTPATAAIRSEFLAELEHLLDTNAYTNGPAVAAFERAFAAACGVATAVGVGSGIDALRLGLTASGIGPGDEVIVPAQTFIATLEAVSQTGATPVPVDVDPLDYTLDAAAAAAAVGGRTRALLPVHLYGQMADVRALAALASGNGLLLAEDACQSHGAVRDGIAAGAAGDWAAFSFYPGKNLGAFGDAGALVTDDERLAEVVVALREHGQTRKYHHDLIGFTSRLDTLQAIVLSLKLPHLQSWTEERSAAAAFYSEALAEVGDLVLPAVAPGSRPVWHLYVICTPQRDALVEHLRDCGIGVGLHYPEPVHLAPAYESLGHSVGDFPVAERLAQESLSLPIFPGMTAHQLEAVVAAVRSFFAHAG